MSAIPQQIFATQKASLDNLLAVQGAFFDGFEKLVDLNLKVMKATLDEAAQKSQEAIEVKDAQEAVAFSSALVQPSAEKSLAYGKHIYDIVSAVQGNISRLTEEQVAQAQRQFSDAVDQYSKTAPTGSESAIALMKSTLASVNNAYESVSKAAKQASETAESNINAATSATLQAASSAAETAARARRTTA
ncbi:MAG TPA: TIGR01841 family phasin [Pusillimonas sp.]|uniref:TIGR01841 family phasin n=1 Tax=Pusillimonas sp. TaxID=3040095 RepID=UPI002C594079|nr:TIGR01841 family phasin [Pusillimonas sp.]HUH87162.1 TIGR01841 family phasin [Pusillimonas sp.]